MKQIEVKVLRSPVSEKYFRPNMAGVYNGVDKIRLGDAWFDYSKTDDRWYVEDETGLSIASFDFALKTKLDALINEAAEEIYTDDFKRGSSFGTPENKLDTLGIMISKYCKWDGDAIKDVAMSAFEDANFHDAVIDLDGEN